VKIVVQDRAGFYEAAFCTTIFTTQPEGRS